MEQGGRGKMDKFSSLKANGLDGRPADVLTGEQKTRPTWRRPGPIPWRGLLAWVSWRDYADAE